MVVPCSAEGSGYKTVHQLKSAIIDVNYIVSGWNSDTNLDYRSIDDVTAIRRLEPVHSSGHPF